MSDLIITDAQQLELYELPQKLRDVAQDFDAHHSTSFLIEVNHDALQKFQQQTNIGFLWSFELLLQTLDYTAIKKQLSSDDVHNIRQYLEHVKTLADHVLEARANILAMLDHAIKESAHE
jgi:hypothetical protein